MADDLTAEEFDRMFEAGEDSEDMYDWEDAELAPPILYGTPVREDLEVVVHVSRSLEGRLDRKARESEQTRSEYLSAEVERLLVTA